MDDKVKTLCIKIFGKKRFEILEFLALHADENGFVFIGIEELCKRLNTSKPTIINTFKFLEEKSLLEKLKNGLYRLK
ncbi:helix-turn-helix domain-containing protein [Campylobacter lari]|uniref:ArsR family transcriptional regulator n=1 Tax=Campylobacter lari TaxID=201 RepID=A0A825SIL3_CAMLA|nr:helix-turn-helix domain-containing protein [Campylobacter lari]EAH6292208.1 ArsR family transcriptional regulator [Campylobacter lari]EAH7837548.1 ArsR family transcriptional regulator [Campylobacter lari]EAI0924011.1 ArsR family transcriptional regulator [Campylobacter lari]EAI1582381.1 ArsR family transcriptional regulator [Campylobacter lari]EAI2015491.1 ArsR family transcriptional regulator [Campylobacter lari]